MSYALRNSLILGILLVIVLSGGAYWVGVRRVAEIDKLEVAQRKTQARLDNVNAVLSIYDTTLAQLDRLKVRWQARKQIVPASDSPARTMVYLHELMRTAGASVSFDFLFKDRLDETGYSVNRYALVGEGRFENLYAFIWHLEHGRRFYTVDHLEIEYAEPEARGAGWDWVDFKVVFRAYFEPKSRVEDMPALQDAGRPDVLVRNPFRPLVTKTLPTNRLGLFQVEEARLMGLTHDLAYLVDKGGQVHMLREGDRIFMGRLSRIDIDRNRVEFTLNRGGIFERRTLKVEMGNSQP